MSYNDPILSPVYMQTRHSQDYNTVWYNSILDTAQQWRKQNLDRMLNRQNTPNNSPPWVNYGM